MSDDQSFYEIQLNTPHLVLAVLGAAVVGVAIFWLGVVIGRGQSAVGGSPEWQGAVPADQGESTAGEDPLEFYEAVGESPAGESETAAQQPTAGGAAGETEQATPPTQAANPAAERGFQPSEPVNEARAPVVADSASGLPRADASLVSGWIVQVRSTPEEDAANALQVALARDGFPAFVVSVEVNGQTYYRVRVGRYPSRGEAQQVEAALLTRSDVETTWVTEG